MSVQASALISSSALRLLVAWQQVFSSFPRREKIEIAEFLGEPDPVVDDSLLLVIPAHLNEPRERKVLAQRVPFKTVIRQNAPHIGMAGEEDAVEIIDLPLKPIRTGE